MNPVIRSEGSTYWLDNFFAAPTFCHGPFEEKIGHLLKNFREQIRQPKRHKVRQKLSLFPNDSTGVMKYE